MSVKKIFPPTSLKKADVLAAEGAFNIGCFVQNGKLFPAINSVTPLNTVLNTVNCAWYSAMTKKYIISGMNMVWASDGEMINPAKGTAIIDYPSMIEISSGGTNAAIITGGTTYFSISEKNGSKPFRGAMHSCVLKNGRVFGVDNTDLYKIKWSGDGGVDDWTDGISGAGWTSVQYGFGKILNLVVYKEKIVAVREYGLTFFSAYGTPENYKLGYLELKIPKIYANTAVVVNDTLLFYTEDGLYCYDGNKVEKSALGLAEEMQTTYSAAGGGDTYFLCGESKTLKRKAVLVVDLIRNCDYLIDAPVKAVAFGERFFGYTDKQEYELEKGGNYAFTSGEIDFSSNAAKVLKEVVISGCKDVQIEVSNGVISRIVWGVRGKFRPNMRGKSFKITVYGSRKIDGIYAIAEVADEV